LETVGAIIGTTKHRG